MTFDYWDRCIRSTFDYHTIHHKILNDWKTERDNYEKLIDNKNKVINELRSSKWNF